MAESDSNGTITGVYTYGPGGPLSMTRGGSTYFYQTNAHGDLVSLTDSTGVVVNTHTYDPWGKVLSAAETVANPLRYAGYYYDTPTDLYYLLNRYYDPGLRRFLNNDGSEEFLREMLGGMFPAWRGLHFEPESWDGSDLFMDSTESGWIVVVEEVAKALTKAKVKNLKFVALSQMELDCRTGTGS